MGFGVLLEVGVGDMPHGVPQVEFADIYLAIGGTKEVDAEVPFVLSYEVRQHPRLHLFLLLGRKNYSLLYLPVVEEDVPAIDTMGGLEEGVAYKVECVPLDAIEEGEVVGYVIEWLEDDALLVADNLGNPGEVIRSWIGVDTALTTPCPRPRGFQDER